MIDVKRINDAVADMKSKVSFDEKKHRYTNKKTKKWLAGVSSISSILPKPFLVPWASKEAVKYLGYEDEKKAKETLVKVMGMSVKEFQKLLHEAKGAYGRKSKDALIDGTKGHFELEKYVLAKINNKPIPDLPTGMLERPVKEFRKWAKENIKQWILSEAMVCDVEEEYAGTLDGLAITNKNKLALIDFKFAGQIGDDYHLQTAGYSLPFEKYGIKIEDRIVIRLPKTLTKQAWNKRTFKYLTKKNNIEIARSPFKYEFDCETFKNARVIYKYINACKNRK